VSVPMTLTDLEWQDMSSFPYIYSKNTSDVHVEDIPWRRRREPAKPEHEMMWSATRRSQLNAGQ